MPGDVSFNVDVQFKDEANLPELRERVKDFSPAFEAIFMEWVDLNDTKFAQSMGHEAGGADQDAKVFWEPLAASTMKTKRRQGRPDWLMVDTGALREAMTNSDRLFDFISEDMTMFGTPLASEESDKVRFNWAKRQAIFLSGPDRNMIRRIVQDYLTLGGNFKEIRFARGLEAANVRREMKAMDTQFGFTVGDTGGGFE